MKNGRRREDARPWYVQFWPWFLIALPSASVIASFISLAIALRNADTLVRDDWSEGGERINDELALDREAHRRQVSAVLRFDEAAQRVSVELSGADARELTSLSLQLRHPTQAERDVSFALAAESPGVFAGRSDRSVWGSWYVTLAPAGDAWRIQQRVWLGAQVPVRLAAAS